MCYICEISGDKCFHLLFFSIIFNSLYGDRVCDRVAVPKYLSFLHLKFTNNVLLIILRKACSVNNVLLFDSVFFCFYDFSIILVVFVWFFF